MSSQSILPTSGAILGAVVEDLRLRLPEEITRSAREYFAGRRPIIKDKTRKRILMAVGQALAAQGYVPDFGKLPSPINKVATTGTVVAAALAVYAHQWDDLVGKLQSEALHDAKAEHAAVAALRLITVDLAVRAAASLRLAQGRPTECDCDLCVFGDVVAPKWPQSDGRRLLVQAIMEQVGDATLEDFAHRLGFADGAIDAWVRTHEPSHPSEEAFDALATALARLDPHIKDARQRWLFGLRWRCAMASIADRLAEVVGRQRVIDLGWALERFVVITLEFFRQSTLHDDEFRQRMLLTINVGVRAPMINHVLNSLARNESDEQWVTAIRTVEKDWLRGILTTILGEVSKQRVADTISTISGLGPASAEALTEIISTTPLPPALLTTPLAKSTALAMLAFNATKAGDLATAAVYLKGAADEDPGRPELHQDLGAHLGLLGRFDEGIAECRKALELRPGWASPLVQIGIMLLDAGRNAEALEHVQGLVGNIEWSPTFGHILGNARLRAGLFEQAIEAFEQVLAHEPNNALSVDAAAHCYLMTGDWSRGRDLAKRAHALGQHMTYQRLDAGAYKKSKADSRGSK